MYTSIIASIDKRFLKYFHFVFKFEATEEVNVHRRVSVTKGDVLPESKRQAVGTHGLPHNCKWKKCVHVSQFPDIEYRTGFIADVIRLLFRNIALCETYY